jgi:hypothetical protein
VFFRTFRAQWDTTGGFMYQGSDPAEKRGLAGGMIPRGTQWLEEWQKVER